MRYIFLFCFYITHGLLAQCPDIATIIEIGEERVSQEDFVRLYTKNNIDGSADFSEASLNEYLELYINYRLKVQEAYALEMDTISRILREFNGYRLQLAESYLTEERITDRLVQEAFERMPVQRDIEHVLIPWEREVDGRIDSAKALNALTKVQRQLSRGYNLQRAAARSGADLTYRSLGYLGLFQTAYAFENAMYKTPIGEISKPVYTRFGIHLVKVNGERTFDGTSSYLQIALPESAENRQLLEQVIGDVEGNSSLFSSYAAQYSTSRNGKSSRNPIKIGAQANSAWQNEYVEKALSIDTIGDVSEIFLLGDTLYLIQWIALDSFPDLDQVRSGLVRKIQQGQRSRIQRDSLLYEARGLFGYNQHTTIEEMLQYFTKDVLSGNADLSVERADMTLFVIGYDTLTYGDLEEYMGHNYGGSEDTYRVYYLVEKFKAYEQKTIYDYYRDHLHEVNVEFATQMQEYRDGMLLFELMNERVWREAVRDTSGLNAFFEENRPSYIWPQLITASHFIVEDSTFLRKLSKASNNSNKLSKLFAKGIKRDKLSSKSWRIWPGDTRLMDFNQLNKLSIGPHALDNGMFLLIEKKEDDVWKTFDETRGFVISDYQDYLEKSWIYLLRETTSVRVTSCFINLVNP